MAENSKSKFAEREEAILEFWRLEKIFAKTLSKPSPKGEFIFYDGPPFATGLPHYGHILAGTIKDVIPRYKTMQGYHVPRRWGWDCHGLPVENIVEKELNLGTKKDIVSYGIDKFNEAASQRVLRFAFDWKKIVPRMGRFVDMDDDYRTMDTTYTESIWWAFSELYKKGLMYEGFKSMHICPRCETTLSNFEVSQGYKDITDISVYVKFEVKPKSPSINSGQPKTYVLGWTTTPWTLPGNAALAVNPDINYAKFKIPDPNFENQLFIAAKNLLPRIIKDGKYEIVEEIKGKELIGLSYIPPFDYYFNDKNLKNRENGWKVYGADFVTTNDGTGIVHIAPSFGEDDYQLSTLHDLPFIQHVDLSGQFKKEVRDFALKKVKPKENTQETDIEIIKYLFSKNLLFAKEKIKHPYPFCWRCETPLLNYASASWFVAVKKLRRKLIAENKRIKWIPSEIGTGRFGTWLSGAKDWSISRSRFWGAPIPLWKCQKCGEKHIVDSIEDLKNKSKAPIVRVIIMRHGESVKNVDRVFDSSMDRYPLTDKGRRQAKEAADFLKNLSVDAIYTSPVRRAEETADIIGRRLGKKPITRKELREVGSGEWDGKRTRDPSILPERMAYNALSLEEYYRSPRGKTGESWKDVEERMTKAFSDIAGKHPGGTILIISHQGPLSYLIRSLKGLTLQETGRQYNNGKIEMFATSQTFYVLPDGRALDIHRPFIDQFSFACLCGGIMNRVNEVFDCWFESGSMPYASNHYPFENLRNCNPKGNFLRDSRGFPADFIAEGLDQTRGWFYSMLVLSVALFGRAPFKAAIVNGTVLAEDGQKMSKRLKNYPDPMDVAMKYGVDALRFYLLSSPVVRAQDLCFSIDGVEEVSKKVFGRLDNVLSFYKLFKPGASDKGHSVLELNELPAELPAKHILDLWIKARMNELVKKVSEGLDRYEIDKAIRPIADFVDDLSTWYLRRSRERFKGEDEEDKNGALLSLRKTLLTLSKIIAPFTPFFGEHIYKNVGGGLLSVHLEDWPEIEARITNKESDILEKMDETRRIVSEALEKRATSGIKVRQPLPRLGIGSRILNAEDEEFLNLIRDEVNVKEIGFHKDGEIYLDTSITPALKEEGLFREFLRAVKDERKRKGLVHGDRVVLIIGANDQNREWVKKHENAIRKSAELREIRFEDLSGEAISVDEMSFVLEILL